MIRGVTVTLYEKRQTGADAFGAPVYTETAVPVLNVLVGEPSAEEAVSELRLSGRRVAYTLAIPKGDAHDWEDVTVEFFGRKWRSFGGVTEGVEGMLPLAWNKKVKVERYD